MASICVSNYRALGVTCFTMEHYNDSLRSEEVTRYPSLQAMVNKRLSNAIHTRYEGNRHIVAISLLMGSWKNPVLIFVREN